MIPTLLVLGLVLGRWWRLVLPVAAVGWPTLLVATGVMRVEPGLLAAAALATLNTGVGVLAFHLLRWVVRWFRRSWSRGGRRESLDERKP